MGSTNDTNVQLCKCCKNTYLQLSLTRPPTLYKHKHIFFCKCFKVESSKREWERDIVQGILVSNILNAQKAHLSVKISFARYVLLTGTGSLSASV